MLTGFNNLYTFFFCFYKPFKVLFRFITASKLTQFQLIDLLASLACSIMLWTHVMSQ